MGNELDELKDYVNEEGRDVNVIEKQLKVTVGWGSKLFEVLLWVPLIIPGLIFQFMKVNAGNYFSKLQQKLQHDASQIDNYRQLQHRGLPLILCKTEGYMHRTRNH